MNIENIINCARRRSWLRADKINRHEKNLDFNAAQRCCGGGGVSVTRIHPSECDFYKLLLRCARRLHAYREICFKFINGGGGGERNTNSS